MATTARGLVDGDAVEGVREGEGLDVVAEGVGGVGGVPVGADDVRDVVCGSDVDGDSEAVGDAGLRVEGGVLVVLGATEP